MRSYMRNLHLRRLARNYTSGSLTDGEKPPVPTRPKPLSRRKREQLEAAARAEKERDETQKAAEARAAEQQQQQEPSLSDSLKAKLMAALTAKEKTPEEKEAALRTPSQAC